MFDLEVGPDFESNEVIEKVRVLPRKVRFSDVLFGFLKLVDRKLGLIIWNFCFLRYFQLHLHAGTDAVLNVTFIRAPSHALLKVDVPLVFRGEDVSPGLKKGNAF